MYSRRDQVQAHSFLVGRLNSAVLRVDPDALERPMRRTVAGLAGGTAVAGLVLAGTLVVNLIAPGSGTAWREPGALIVDEGTGGRYLMVDGKLRPVLNYASARLLLGANPKVATVTAADITGVPQGGPIGIMGAPDSLPNPGGAQRTWTVCAMTTPDGPGVALAIGVGGTPQPPVDGALLVRAPNGGLHLAWRDRRLRVTATWVPAALGLDPTAAVPVTESWLNALPEGPDLGSPKISRGGSGPTIGGEPTTVGQLLQVPEAVVGERFYLVQAGGLMPVSATVAALLVADPASPQPSRKIAAADLATATMLPAPDWQTGLPPEPPHQIDLADGANSAPCVRWTGDTATLTVGPRLTGDPDPAVQGTDHDNRTADHVTVAPGAGLLVRTRPAPGVPGAGMYLVTDAGTKFPVASGDAATALGQPVEGAAAVPADLIALLPTGPVLDRLK